MTSSCWDLRTNQRTNPRCTNMHTKRGRQDLRGLARCLHPRDRRKRSIDDLRKIKRIILGSLKNTHQLNLTIQWILSSIYKEKKKPPHSSRLDPELLLMRLWPVDWPKCTVDCPVDCAKSCKIVGLTGNVKSTDQIGFLFLVHHQSTVQSIDYNSCACRSTEPLA